MLTGTNLSTLSATIAGIYVISPISLFWIFILLTSAADINITQPMYNVVINSKQYLLNITR